MKDPANYLNTVDLVHQARRGNRASLHLLLERYSDRLLDRIRLMMGEAARSHAESGDFLQGVFVEILEGFDRFHPDDDRAFLRWATQIARNNIRDHLRRRRERALESTALELGLGPSPPGESPAEQAVQLEHIELVVDALAEMPADQRQVIELRHFEQMGFADIGVAMSRSDDASRFLYARAVLKLARQLGRGP